MSKYNILAVDLDGTLLREDKSLSEVNRETLVEAQQRGMTLILASGRPTYGVATLADRLQLKAYGGYVLAYNGGEIFDWKSKRALYTTTIPNEHKAYLYRMAKEAGCEILTYVGQQVIAEDDTNRYVQRTMRANGMTCKRVANVLEATEQEAVTKYMIVGNPEVLPRLEKEMQAQLAGEMGVFVSEPFYLELVPAGINKANGLARLLDATGMSRNHLIAVGDALNDVQMIEFAQLGVAMANASERVLQIADYVTGSNEEDGVAQVVRKFILPCAPSQ